ncbi:hypothetical protein SETIT_1G211600v2 [Setaria italica]|uniref:DUF7894 domain-containing protein n=1 Tax=Setaria italica TaxID=4555 RepID=K3YVD5_SETIT|nr:uncharacterized protein LOC101784075 [Setaria italica]RCV07034.1 hypothetical protein SETIT_1G211600v2 [Setaria italica]
MRVAPKVLVLVRDTAGYGAAIADALRPPPGLTRESSPLELPLGKYGLDGEKASVELLSFSDSSGSPQVTIFVVPDYKPPLAACAMNEVLELISSEATSTEQVLIVPFITRSSSYHHGMENATKASPVLHGAEIGATTDFTHLFVDGTTKPPTSLQIRTEPILCLLEMVRVLKMPTVLFVASGGQQQGKSSTVSDLEILQCVGEHLARHTNLEFSKESILERGIEKSPIIQEPWRELYG